MRIHRFVTLFLALALALTFAGCGGSGSCQSLCSEGQSGKCTSIKGDCGKFCDALNNVDDKAGCASLKDAYISCLNGKDNVCDTSCGSQESALSTCIGKYCVLNLTSADCQTLIAAFK